MKARKLRLCWTCSDFIHHEHRWRWTAWVCAQLQRFLGWPNDDLV